MTLATQRCLQLGCFRGGSGTEARAPTLAMRRRLLLGGVKQQGGWHLSCTQHILRQLHLGGPMQRRQGLHAMKGLLTILLSPSMQASRDLHARTVSASQMHS